jgi:CheY-like chemotaxis protein
MTFKKTIECLLIDDDLDDQEIFWMALAQACPGTRCMVITSGLEALKKFRGDDTYIPDYIFLDVKMPKMNGIQCLAEIKQMRHLGNAKVVVYSGSLDHRVTAECTRLGAAGFLQKPAGLRVLTEKLTAILSLGQ